MRRIFQYADSGSRKNRPIPAAYSSWGTFYILEILNERTIPSFLEKAAQAHAKPRKHLQKVGDFYASGMDTTLINREGVKPLVFAGPVLGGQTYCTRRRFCWPRRNAGESGRVH